MKYNDKVKVKDRILLETDRRFGLALPMEHMRGRTFKVIKETKCGRGVKLEHPDNKLHYCFSKNDVELVFPKPTLKGVTMNVDNKVERVKKKIKRTSLVRLSKNLTKSIKAFGGSTAKRRMQGTIQKVYRLSSYYITIVENISRAKWSILYEDIDEVIDKDKGVIFSVIERDPVSEVLTSPQVFDPTNLVL